LSELKRRGATVDATVLEALRMLFRLGVDPPTTTERRERHGDDDAPARQRAAARWRGAQSGWVASALEARHPGLAVELVLIRTTGDRMQQGRSRRPAAKGSS
jgi:hypothetical protein